MSVSSRNEMPAWALGKLPEAAADGQNAVALGNRAGIIEWANSAWQRVSGYDLERFIQKPVAALLEHVEFETSVVDFVAGCIHENKACEVDVPLTTPSGENVWIHLRVEPMLDAAGEVSDFVAIARDITAAKHAELRERETAEASITAIDLSELARSVALAHIDSLHPMSAYDLWLGEDLPFVLAAPSLLEGLVGRLIRRATACMCGGWGTLSVSTGLLGGDAGTVYSGNLYRGLPHAQFAYLEVHDTGNGPSGGEHRAIEEPFITNHYSDEPLRLAAARRLLARQDGEIRLASSPWFGTSVVLLLPYSVEPDFDIH
jgi:PAS domain S-box-containing protein